MKAGNLRNILYGVSEILDGLALLLTLGFWHPNLGYRFLAWAERRYLKQQIILKDRWKSAR